jgi:RNA polymerase sporulation-specific sigma factor
LTAARVATNLCGVRQCAEVTDMAQVGESGVILRPFVRMGDAELVAQVRRGSRCALDKLLARHRDLVIRKASAYFVAGADHDDVIQEGRIGLFKAVRDFSSDGLCSFRSFAELCITRQIITAVKSAARQKHALLSTCLSMDMSDEDDGEERGLAETLAAIRQPGPEDTVIGRDMQRELRTRIGRELSELEACAVLRHIEGHSYHDIARELGLGVKQIDNALQRAKRKLGPTAAEVIFA